MTLREGVRRTIATELVYFACRAHAGAVADLARGIVAVADGEDLARAVASLELERRRG